MSATSTGMVCSRAWEHHKAEMVQLLGIFIYLHNM
jgi:hypothetical protein